MRQIVYISMATGPVDALATASILLASRRNNAQNCVTGVLYFDGVHFIQALEGLAPHVGETFERIGHDPRHGGIRLLSDRAIVKREFGDWAMAHPRRDEDGPAGAIAKLRRLAAGASPATRASLRRCPGLFAEFSPG